MNIRMVALGAACLAGVSCYAQELTFKNKTNSTVRVAVGSRAVPAYSIPFVKTTAPSVKAGKDIVIKNVVSNDQFPQILVWEDGKPNTAYVYEIGAKAGKRLMVQLMGDSKKFTLSSVPFTFNTISKDNIRLDQMVSLTQEGKKSLGQFGPTAG